ncbi:anti-adapter protein IraM [Dryocola sp. BD586]|jgi:hypothetical protein|uniref:anti-adapter protein IraM n=1 Tax=Dryocola sp. BD586 TaxID=3133271 RepID=UPI003F50713C
MKWKVIDSLVSPSTGTVFSCVISARNLKLVLWYEATLFLKAGDELTTSDLGFFINGRKNEIALCNVSAFNAQLWKTMREKSECPGNGIDHPQTCTNPAPCKIKTCPFGLNKASEPV